MEGRGNVVFVGNVVLATLEWQREENFCNKAHLVVVFESPVPRLEKDRDWTGPRPEKTRPAV